MINFPANPSAGMTYEVAPGIVYIFDSASKSWTRLEGKPVGPATPTSDGLMTSTDFIKAWGIPVPIPRATLASPQSPTRFVGGNIELMGRGFVHVTGAKNIAGQDYELKLSQNTASIDFSILKDKLIKHLVGTGQLVISGKSGKKGPVGPDGDDGQPLNTGRLGDQGADAIRPPCDLSTGVDSLDYRPIRGDKVVVDIGVRRVDVNSYVLVVTLGILGNPDAAPNTVVMDAACDSSTVLAVASPTTNPQPLYAVDLAPIYAALADKLEQDMIGSRDRSQAQMIDGVAAIKEELERQRTDLCCQLFECLKQKAAGIPPTVGRGSVAAARVFYHTGPIPQRNGDEVVSYLGQDFAIVSLPDGQQMAWPLVGGNVADISHGRYAIKRDQDFITKTGKDVLSLWLT